MKRSHFTLVEMLTVLAIIMVLMGLGIPVYLKVKSTASKTDCKARMHQLELAIRAYETTYQTLPFVLDYNSGAIVVQLINTDIDNAGLYYNLVECLAGRDAALNPRQVPFLESDKDGKFKDPWARNFRVALDLDYDNSIPMTDVHGRTSAIGKTLVIWSCGPDQQTSAVPADAVNRDNIYSYD